MLLTVFEVVHVMLATSRCLLSRVSSSNICHQPRLLVVFNVGNELVRQQYIVRPVDDIKTMRLMSQNCHLTLSIPHHANPKFCISGFLVNIESTSTHCLNLFKKATNQISKNEIENVCEKDCNEFRFLQFYICKYVCIHDFEQCRADEPSLDFENYYSV